MLISQKYTLIPARLRSNASWLILFRLNPVDFENVFRDVISLRRAMWEELLRAVFGEDEALFMGENGGEKKFNNMGIWVEKDIFFKNFERLIINVNNNNYQSFKKPKALGLGGMNKSLPSSSKMIGDPGSIAPSHL